MANEANPLIALSDAMAEAVEKAGASTLLVEARRRMPASGIAYASDLVLTADHVVEREEDIRLVLPDGSQRSASLAGRDSGNDLALLRLSEAGLSPAQAAARPARVGQLALALGRPSTEGIQASLGVVSALGGPVRTGRGGLLEQYIRTDTIPYPGFSGGPLIDANGGVLGLNTSGLAHGGIALTIPVGLAWQVAEALRRHGRVRRGYLGIRSQPTALPAVQQQALGREQPSGLLLVGIEEGSPAMQAGLMVGDILVSLAGEPLTDPDDLLVRLAGEMVGQSVPLEVLRGGQPVKIAVRIGERK
ncbi:MAG: signal protein PDZ [Chloroflexi bacterium RBG_16_57_11]|nr:MAG: signal protein PDZ [Chloroflexi bacterium RBG_16_57_11]